MNRHVRRLVFILYSKTQRKIAKALLGNYLSTNTGLSLPLILIGISKYCSYYIAGSAKKKLKAVFFHSAVSLI